MNKLSLELHKTPYVSLFPLPGISFESDSFYIDDVLITKLEFEDFLMIEKSQFIDDLEGYYLDDTDPWFAVLTSGNKAETLLLKLMNSGIATNLPNIKILNILLSMRLCKTGEIFNPFEFINYQRYNNTNERNTNLFGRQVYTRRVEEHFSIKDIEEIKKIYDNLLFFNRFREDISLDRAILLLSASYSPLHTTFCQKVLPLLPAIEILAGDDISLLKNAKYLSKEARNLIKSFVSERNIIAHGAKEVVFNDVKVYREIIQALIKEALIWNIEDTSIEKINRKLLIQRCLSNDPTDINRMKI